MLAILVIADYIQIVPAEERDVRARVAAVVESLRKIAKRMRIVMLAISQPSRAAGQALAHGELVGADSMTAMAETAAIERSAYTTLAIGAHGPEREDGSCSVDLNIGKGRMGGGDRVFPMSFTGRSGLWRVAGESKPASQSDQRTVQADAAAVSAAKLAMITFADRAKEPVTRARAEDCSAVQEIGTVAVDELLAEGSLVGAPQEEARTGLADLDVGQGAGGRHPDDWRGRMTTAPLRPDLSPGATPTTAAPPYGGSVVVELRDSTQARDERHEGVAARAGPHSRAVAVASGARRSQLVSQYRQVGMLKTCRSNRPISTEKAAPALVRRSLPRSGPSFCQTFGCSACCLSPTTPRTNA